MTTRAKAEARKAKAIEREKGKRLLQAFEKSVHFFDGCSPEEMERFQTEFGHLPPDEQAKKMLRFVLAADVRDKIKAELPNETISAAEVDACGDTLPPGITPGDCVGATVHDLADTITDDNVVEYLEALVEGDLVLDDAATHQWHRNKLDEYRDTCIKIDADIPDIENFTTATFLLAALDHFDVLVDHVKDAAPGEFGIIANQAGRRALAGFPFDWTEILPSEGKELTKDFLAAGVVLSRGEGAPPLPNDPARYLAKFVADNSSLRVGIIKRYGEVEPITAEAS